MFLTVFQTLQFPGKWLQNCWCVTLHLEALSLQKIPQSEMCSLLGVLDDQTTSAVIYKPHPIRQKWTSSILSLFACVSSTESDTGLPATSWQYNTCFVPNRFKNVITKKKSRKKTKRKKWEFPETIKWNWNRTFVFSKVLVVILNYYYDSTQRRKGDRKYWSKVTKDLSTCVSQPVLTQPSCFMCASIAY